MGRVLSDFHRLPRDVRKIIYKMIGRKGYAFKRAFDESLNFSEKELTLELILAVQQYPNIAYLEWLKEEGAQWSIRAFSVAVRSDNIQVVSWFIRYQGILFDGTPFKNAESIDMFRLLSEHIKTFDMKEVLEDAVIYHKVDWVTSLLRPSTSDIYHFVYDSFCVQPDIFTNIPKIFSDCKQFAEVLKLVKFGRIAQKAMLFLTFLIGYDNDIQTRHLLYEIRLDKDALDENILKAFLRFGQIHTIRYLHEKFPELFMKYWKAEYVRYDDREFIEFLLDNKIPVDTNNRTFWKKNKIMRVLSDFHRLPRDVRKMLYKMIGRLKMHSYVFAFMKAFDKTLTIRLDIRWELCDAMYFQDIPYIAWLKEEGVPWTSQSFEIAVATGNLNLVKWLIRHQCLVNPNRALYASKTVEMFQFISETYFSTNREVDWEVLEDLFEYERFDWALEYLKPSQRSFSRFVDESFVSFEELEVMTERIYYTDRDANFYKGFQKFLEIYGIADYLVRYFYEMLISYDDYEDVEPYLTELKISHLNPKHLQNFLKFGKPHTIRYIHQKFPEEFKVAWKKEYARYDDREFVEYMLDHEIPVNSDDTRLWKRLKKCDYLA